MIAGILVLLGRCFGTQGACGVIICRFTCPGACLVVGVHIGLAKVGVILPGQLAQLVIGVPGHMAALVGDSGDVAAGVIGVGIPGGGVADDRLVGANLAGCLLEYIFYCYLLFSYFFISLNEMSN